MRTYTKIVHEGEDMGPVDWSHPTAKDMPPIWREAEQNPDGFLLLENGAFRAREIFKICMYDGWPYWKPTPAIFHASPLGGGEWAFFNSYGVNSSSIIRKPRDTDRSGGADETAQQAQPEGREPGSEGHRPDTPSQSQEPSK